MNFDFKNGMNLRIITKNHAAGAEKGFLRKWISKSYDRSTAMPPVWELILIWLSSNGENDYMIQKNAKERAS